ncbi:hypothetical protein DW085_13070 [Clostridium sp. AF50-3]|nr:hypothetical protein DW085_13070 [Clostridium sp. AF50-3]
MPEFRLPSLLFFDHHMVPGDRRDVGHLFAGGDRLAKLLQEFLLFKRSHGRDIIFIGSVITEDVP